MKFNFKKGLATAVNAVMTVGFTALIIGIIAGLVFTLAEVFPWFPAVTALMICLLLLLAAFVFGGLKDEI
jgi:hypothetical protein